MAKLRIHVQAVTKGVKDGLKRTVEMAKDAKKKLAKIPLWGQFAGAMGLTSAISRITTTIINSVSAARRFQRQMSEINTIARLSARGISLLKSQVNSLSVELGVTTDTLTGGLYEALSAGIPQNNVIDFLRIATKASVAGVTSVTVAVDGLTSVLNAYKMDISETERISDIFFETIRLGKTKFDQLSDSIGLVLPMANAAGVSFLELGAALATMTKQGLSTDKSATALRGIMQDLINPSENLLKVIKLIEKDLGIASISALDFQEQMRLIGKKAKETGMNLASLFENVRAFTGALQLMGENAREAAKDLDTIRMGVGSLENAYKEFEGTSDRVLKKAEQRWEAFKRTVGEKLTIALAFVFNESDYQRDIKSRIDRQKKAEFGVSFLEGKAKKAKETGTEIPIGIVKDESALFYEDQIIKLSAIRKLIIANEEENKKGQKNKSRTSGFI